MLENEFKYYLEHQNELVRKYDGRYLVVVGEAVVGDYATFSEALSAAQKDYEMGTFLIQKCTEGDKDYTAKYHSRVRLTNAGIHC